MSNSAFYSNAALWQELLPGGCHWSGRIRRGTVLQFTALQTNANVSMLFFNAEEKLERYNMPDSLKAQHTAFLTAGHVCYSDLGRILCSVVRDDTGWIDTICGVSDAANITKKYGSNTFGNSRNGMYRNGRDGLLIELEKWGLAARDLVANVNLFSKVTVDDAGSLHYQADHTKAEDVIELRFEMDTLLVLSAAPHPLSTAETYSPSPVRMTAYKALPVAADDLCRTSCEQNTRGFLNNARYFGDL